MTIETDSDKRQMSENNLCFLCNFWLQKLNFRVDPTYVNRIVVIGSSHYILGDATKPSNWNGFGGRWFYIKFNDGSIVKTCDLWHQGSIPARWQPVMPNNASFITKEEFEQHIKEVQLATLNATNTNATTTIAQEGTDNG